MTENEWLASTDWRPMRLHLKAQMNNSRKARLFAVACCRRIAHLFEDPRADEALAVCELFADKLASAERLREAAEAARDAIRKAMDTTGSNALSWARDAAWRASLPTNVWHGVRSCLNTLGKKDEPAERAAQTVLLRDVFGNPFRPPKRERAWLTSDVLALARGIYDERAFDRMPILADALQDAGCTNEYILSHCRDTNLPHVRGCWVVDLLLGRK